MVITLLRIPRTSKATLHNLRSLGNSGGWDRGDGTPFVLTRSGLFAIGLCDCGCFWGGEGEDAEGGEEEEGGEFEELHFDVVLKR